MLNRACVLVAALAIGGCGHPTNLETYRQIVDKAKAEDKLVTGPDLERTQAIVARLMVVVTHVVPAVKDVTCEVNILDGPNVGAWVVSGCKILMTSQMIKGAHLTDDELACAMGHELAHLLLGHPQKLSRAGALTPVRLFALTRSLELDADRVGARLATEAGFNPDAMVTMLEKLRTMAPEPGVYAQYPAWDDRIAQARGIIRASTR